MLLKSRSKLKSITNPLEYYIDPAANYISRLKTSLFKKTSIPIL